EDDKIPMVELMEVAKEMEPTSTTFELKELPKHLKYVFLDESKKKPVIIFAELSKDEENELVEMLKKNERAIGWNLGDIKGISP
ncbi:hypothetical protein, partial [Clostridioides difficile]|uniref:hypothetical protein n=1 Tax=Clostridioides difficile TaxID=1496 RepID=UPI002113A4A5